MLNRSAITLINQIVAYTCRHSDIKGFSTRLEWFSICPPISSYTESVLFSGTYLVRRNIHCHIMFTIAFTICIIQSYSISSAIQGISMLVIPLARIVLTFGSIVAIGFFTCYFAEEYRRRHPVYYKPSTSLEKTVIAFAVFVKEHKLDFSPWLIKRRTLYKCSIIIESNVSCQHFRRHTKQCKE